MNVISAYTGLRQYIKARNTKTTKVFSTKLCGISAMATLTMLPCQSCQQQFNLVMDFPQNSKFC